MTITVDISWPGTIPLPFVDYSGSPRNATITSPLESPRIYYRSRFATSYATIDATWVLTATEYTAFQTFFADTLGNGTACFSLELKYPQNSVLTSWMVRFAGAYEAVQGDGPISVSAQLDLVRNLVIPDAAS